LRSLGDTDHRAEMDGKHQLDLKTCTLKMRAR
jgi:hypothetical protein